MSQSEETTNQDASVDASVDAGQAEADWQVWRNFERELDFYAESNHMTRAWKGWVWWNSLSGSGQDPRKNRFYGPFVRARRTAPEGQTWVLLFKYEEGRSPDSVYNPPYSGATFQEREQEHFRVIGEMLREVFTDRWHFELHSAGLGNEISEEEADVVVTLGYTGPASISGGKYLHLIFDGALAHEMLHQFGFRHHYCQWPETPEQEAVCSERPPDEGPCMMSRDSELLGPLEQFILQVKYDDHVRTSQQAEVLNWQMAQRQNP